jgi:hypothetical protein
MKWKKFTIRNRSNVGFKTNRYYEFKNKVQAVWKTVKMETGKYSTTECSSSIKINSSTIKNPQLIPNPFNTQ